MRCFHPLTLSSRQVVPCGSCIACRINHTSQWTIRLLAEKQYWDKSSFVTLTYDDEHLKDMSLHPEDLTKFLKRLRKYLDVPIKYYACGEYGSKTARPHYHLILFGVGQSKYEREAIAKCWKLCNPVKFTDARTKGVCCVTKDDIQYVAGYCQKKLTGVQGTQAYIEKGLFPPFQRSSQKLGLRYFQENSDLVLDEDLNVNLWNGQLISCPRYIRDKLGLKYDKTKAFEHKLEKINETYEMSPQMVHLMVRRGLTDELYRQLSEKEVEEAMQHYFAKKAIGGNHGNRNL